VHAAREIHSARRGPGVGGLRRSCARWCHAAGGELEQIQFLLGHASVLTIERYIGCKQNLSHPVNDRIQLNFAK
jgi:integrase